MNVHGVLLFVFVISSIAQKQRFVKRFEKNDEKKRGIFSKRFPSEISADGNDDLFHVVA
jgi:hypothetical protein